MNTVTQRGHDLIKSDRNVIYIITIYFLIFSTLIRNISSEGFLKDRVNNNKRINIYIKNILK